MGYTLYRYLTSTWDGVEAKMEVSEMFALRKWHPFGELSTLHREMDEFFRKAFEAMGGLTPSLLRETWYPAVESFMKEGNIIVRAEIPGIDPKDIDISVVGNQLTIKGERKAEKGVKEEDYLLNEICYSAFERTVTLPEGVKAENVHASYRNGILEVTMPAEKAVLPKKVTVEIAEEVKKAA